MESLIYRMYVMRSHQQTKSTTETTPSGITNSSKYSFNSFLYHHLS